MQGFSPERRERKKVRGLEYGGWWALEWRRATNKSHTHSVPHCIFNLCVFIWVCSCVSQVQRKGTFCFLFLPPWYFRTGRGREQADMATYTVALSLSPCSFINLRRRRCTSTLSHIWNTKVQQIQMYSLSPYKPRHMVYTWQVYMCGYTHMGGNTHM